MAAIERGEQTPRPCGPEVVRAPSRKPAPDPAQVQDLVETVARHLSRTHERLSILAEAIDEIAGWLGVDLADTEPPAAPSAQHPPSVSVADTQPERLDRVEELESEDEPVGSSAAVADVPGPTPSELREPAAPSASEQGGVPAGPPPSSARALRRARAAQLAAALPPAPPARRALTLPATTRAVPPARAPSAETEAAAEPLPWRARRALRQTARESDA